MSVFGPAQRPQYCFVGDVTVVDPPQLCFITRTNMFCGPTATILFQYAVDYLETNIWGALEEQLWRHLSTTVNYSFEIIISNSTTENYLDSCPLPGARCYSRQFYLNIPTPEDNIVLVREIYSGRSTTAIIIA